MKLSAYIIAIDSGFAPNPFGRYCTLACCKPTIRRNAEVGDIIGGTASASSNRPGHLIYAMKVKQILPYQQYWTDPRFAHRKPSQQTAITRCGGNIWHRVKGGKAGAIHSLQGKPGGRKPGPSIAPPILERLDLSPELWLQVVEQFGKRRAANRVTPTSRFNAAVPSSVPASMSRHG